MPIRNARYPSINDFHLLTHMPNVPIWQHIELARATLPVLHHVSHVIFRAGSLCSEILPLASGVILTQFTHASTEMRKSQCADLLLVHLVVCSRIIAIWPMCIYIFPAGRAHQHFAEIIWLPIVFWIFSVWEWHPG